MSTPADGRTRLQRALGNVLFASCVVVLVVTMVAVLRIWPGLWRPAPQAAVLKSCAVTVIGTVPGPAMAGEKASPPALSPQDIRQAVEKTESCLENHVMNSVADQKALLDRLVTLISVYSILLGAAALFNLKLARDDADKQVAAMKELSAKAVSDFDKALADLPDVRRLSTAVQDQMGSLIRVLGPEFNWNDDQPYSNLDEEDRQKVLMGEIAVGALPIFVKPGAASNAVDLARIYRSLARFYYAKYRAKPSEDADFSRAKLYLDESKRLQPLDAGTYRLLGGIHLGRSARLKPENKNEIQFCRNEAESYCRKAIELDSRDLGAYYNLALSFYRRNLVTEAIEWSETALKDVARFDDQHTRKYLPSVFVNLACYFNKPFNRAPSAAELEKVGATLERGKETILKTKLPGAISGFEELILKELSSGGDLENVPDEVRVRIRAVLEEIRKNV